MSPLYVNVFVKVSRDYHEYYLQQCRILSFTLDHILNLYKSPKIVGNSTLDSFIWSVNPLLHPSTKVLSYSTRL